MLHIIWSIIVGFIVGLIARSIMPGIQHLGFIMTTLLGRIYHVDYRRAYSALCLGKNESVMSM